MRKLLVVLLVLTAVQTAAAQERRRSPDGGAGPSLPYSPGNPDVPLSGSWMGVMTRTGLGTFPVAVNIDFANGKYAGASSIAPGQMSPHVNSRATGKTMRWEEESALGVLLYTATLVSVDSIAGTVTLRDAKASDPSVAQGSFTLVRAKQPMGRSRND